MEAEHNKEGSMTAYNDCIIFLLTKANQKAQGNFKKRLSIHGLTPVQNLILETLWEKGGLSAGEISKRLLLDNATLSGVLDRLAGTGWIEKQTDTNDRRFLRIFPTPKALEMKETLQEERSAANENILERFSIEEKVLLKRMLKTLQQ